MYEKYGYGNFDHWYNIYPTHLHTLLGVGTFTKVFRVFAGLLWSGPRLSKILERLLQSVNFLGCIVYRTMRTYIYKKNIVVFQTYNFKRSDDIKEEISVSKTHARLYIHVLEVC